MKTKIVPFTYDRPYRIATWGYTFDSLTELKYAVSIMDEYEFMREPVSIYYDPRTRMPVDQIRQFCRRYTPDFLIRHRETREALLIEIKPRMIAFHPKLAITQTVAENFIAQEILDWKYKIVYDDEIVLSADQLEEFDVCFKLNSKSSWKTWFEEYRKRFSARNSSIFRYPSENRRLQFLMFGNSDFGNPNKWRKVK